MKAYADFYLKKHPNANKYEVERHRLYTRILLICTGAVLFSAGCFFVSMADSAAVFSLLAGIAFLTVGIVYYKK